MRYQNATGFVLHSLMRYAIRTLRKNLGLTLVIVASLAIGIGANSAIFSVVNALLLHPLPYPNPDGLAAIWLHSPGIGICWHEAVVSSFGTGRAGGAHRRRAWKSGEFIVDKSREKPVSRCGNPGADAKSARRQRGL